jgi:hypothetical protein
MSPQLLGAGFSNSRSVLLQLRSRLLRPQEPHNRKANRPAGSRIDSQHGEMTGVKEIAPSFVDFVHAALRLSRSSLELIEGVLAAFAQFNNDTRSRGVMAKLEGTRILRADGSDDSHSPPSRPEPLRWTPSFAGSFALAGEGEPPRGIARSGEPPRNRTETPQISCRS